MSVGQFLQQSWMRRVQGEYVLSIARVLYLAIAGLSLAAVALGIAAALFFEFGARETPALKPVPDIPAPTAVALDLDTIRGGFLPPTNIRGVPIPFTRPITTDTVLVYLDADSGRGLAPYPDDFLILGGPDAPIFERGTWNVDGRAHTALRPSADLVAQLNGQSSARAFIVRVAAKDAGGGVSQPVLLHLTLSPAAQGITPVPIAPASASALDTLARRIALFADPARTPAYFDAYQRAEREPQQCGTSSDDANFLAEYQRAFDYMRSRMIPDRIPTFYAALCSAWSAAIRAQRLVGEQAQAQRAQTIAENMQEQVRAETSAFAARMERNAALVFAVGALGLFLFLSLFLAFLAIESHSKAMRETLAMLAERSRTP
jgi:hypothetical protein